MNRKNMYTCKYKGHNFLCIQKQFANNNDNNNNHDNKDNTATGTTKYIRKP